MIDSPAVPVAGRRGGEGERSLERRWGRHESGEQRKESLRGWRGRRRRRVW